MKPTDADPEDNRQPDSAMPYRSTSKMWNPGHDRGFWTEYGAAGDTSEGSTAGPALMSIHEMSNLDEELLREIQDRVTRAPVARGSGQ